MIEHQMQLEAEELSHAGLAARRQPLEHFMPNDASIMAYRQRGGVHLVDAGLLPERLAKNIVNGTKIRGLSAMKRS
jgi:hypothetical protein